MPAAIVFHLAAALAPAPAPTPDGEAAQASPSAAEEAAPADEGDVTKYRFTGLDIEGELRTPALLQFLAKIAGAFETLGIPHRSFMPELEATLEEDVL
ncbi:MAG: hypothetical protein D6705_01010 [Deltaproteobacteria bacterium]|nr:MAG: hypothetical protein D6705_01010 [Deltaproteobacteria bacterium]